MCRQYRAKFSHENALFFHTKAQGSQLKNMYLNIFRATCLHCIFRNVVVSLYGIRLAKLLVGGVTLEDYFVG